MTGVAMRTIMVLVGISLGQVSGRLYAAPADCDAVVYGATPGGIAAAMAAAREGLSVALVEPTAHVGGMTTSGLTHTDFHTYEALTGSFLEFAVRVADDYRRTYGADSQELEDCRHGTQAEPHVNERIFEQMLAEARVTIYRRQTLRSARVETADGRKVIRAIEVENPQGVSKVIAAKMFIDGSYEGDLSAAVGVPYRVGREGRDEYGESLAPPKADTELQGYNFRLIMTRNPEVRVPVEMPDGYRSEDFVELLPVIAAGQLKSVFGYPKDCAFKAQIPGMPRGKFDINDVSRSAVRLSMPGENLEWPEGDAAARERIFKQHLRYNVGLLWFLQNDPNVPDDFRREAREWGWCKDEFLDNGHLPWQLYVREARRIIGQHVYTQRDLEPVPGDARARLRPQSIAISDYGPNCHGTSHSGPRFGGMHEGQIYHFTAPYQIPYGVLVPRDVDNLLAPVACSASHVGFCALRYEPTWMGLGQAAGLAASQAIRDEVPVDKVSVSELQAALHSQGAATIYVSDVPPKSPWFRAVQWLGTMGGLHGLHATPNELRGEVLEGQYWAAFPGHDFQPNAPLAPQLWDRWMASLPNDVRTRVNSRLAYESTLTRGAAAQKLFEAVQAGPRP